MEIALELVSKTSDRVFDDTLTDMNGLCLFDLSQQKFKKNYPWMQTANTSDWERLAAEWLDNQANRKPIYVRFVDPCSARFGSIAKIVHHSYSSWSNFSRNTVAQTQSAILNLARNKLISGELRFSKRNSKPSFYSRGECVEWLPNYTGDTVWQYDRERAQRVVAKPAYDKLNREIQVGDFCTYILYQFDGAGAAGIYFGNVTRIDKDGQVFCKNVSLKPNDKVAEKAIKDNKLITILTDDLMKQLMLAKLSSQ